MLILEVSNIIYVTGFYYDRKSVPLTDNTVLEEGLEK